MRYLRRWRSAAHIAYIILGVGLLANLTKPFLAALTARGARSGLVRLPELARRLVAYTRSGLRAMRDPRPRSRRPAHPVAGEHAPDTQPGPPGLDWDGVAEPPPAGRCLPADARRPAAVYDHHSQFPSTLQMLYAPMLAFSGPAAARLLHFAFGLLTMPPHTR